MSAKYIHILIEHEMENGRAVDKNVIGTYSNKSKARKAYRQFTEMSDEKEHLYTTQRWNVQ